MNETFETITGVKVVALVFGFIGAALGISYTPAITKRTAFAALEAGRQVAMQVAAMNPIAINKDGVDARTIEREIEVGKELAIQEGKPADMAEKIAMGRLNKFFQENTLLSQQFVRDNKLTVEQFLNTTEKGLTVTDFRRFSLS